MAAPPRTKSRSQERWVLLPALVYGLASLFLVGVVFLGSLRLVDSTFPGFLVLDNGIIAAFRGADWTGFEAGLPMNGGLLLSFEERPFQGGRALLDAVAETAPGARLRYRVQHEGRVETFVVPTMRFGVDVYRSTLGSYLFLAVAFLATGAIALALRPDLLAARALAAAGAMMGGLFALAIDHLTAYRMVLAYQLVESFAPLAAFYLALVFPIERVGARTRHWLVGGLAAALLAVAVVEAWLFYESPLISHQWDAAADVLLSVLGFVFALSFADAFIRGRDPEQRIRAAIVFAGALVAFVPALAERLGFFVLGLDISSNLLAPFLVLFLASFLYAIVRHNLLEAERVVRLGVGYAIATTVVLLVYASSLAALSRLVWPGAQESAGASFILVLLIAVSFEPLRSRVQRGIDRAFYRSRVDVGRELEESSGELATLGSEREIARYVERRLRECLALEWAELRPLGAGGPEARVREPVSFREEPLGELVGGAKRSGAPFSSSELDLLKGLAAQTALAIHNARAIQALRDAQQQLLRTERLAAVGEFAGAVAHGIRNPLAGIRAAAQVARQEAGDGPLADSLEGVLAEADRLDHRIRTLLDFSRPYVPTPVPTDLCMLAAEVARAIRPQAERQGVTVDVEAPSAPVESPVDPNYLEEALLELSANALRAMSEGGKLRVSVGGEGPGACIRIADTGSGIPAGVVARVFDLFFTTRADGTGMGLATVKKIVELNGGRIALESTGPGGTVFRVDLPQPAGRPG